MMFAAGLMACDRDAAPIADAPADAAEEVAVEIEADPPGPDREALRERTRQVLGELPIEAPSDANPLSDEKIALGRMLYFDPRLSKNHDISCNSCHDLQRFGVDGEPTSPGHRGQRGGRNSPTVLNAALHSSQFWDGREPDVEAQAKGPILNPIEMAMPSEEAVLAVVKKIPAGQVMNDNDVRVAVGISDQRWRKVRGSLRLNSCWMKLPGNAIVWGRESTIKNVTERIRELE